MKEQDLMSRKVNKQTNNEAKETKRLFLHFSDFTTTRNHLQLLFLLCSTLLLTPLDILEATNATVYVISVT